MKTPTIQTIYDRLFNCNSKRVANASMAALNSIQDYPADEQLAAVGVLFLVLTKRFGIQPDNVLNCVDNMIKDSKRYDLATFQGITEYFKQEI